VEVDVGVEGEVAATALPDDGIVTRLRSRTGRRWLFQASMRGREPSTTATSMAGHLSAITAMDGPPT
jgi:hypothetical protein